MAIAQIKKLLIANLLLAFLILFYHQRKVSRLELPKKFKPTLKN